MTKNLVLNQIRSFNYDIAYKKNCLPQSEVWGYQQNNTLDSVIFNDLKSYLYNEIEKLPAGMKGIFKLSRIQMLSNEEIAKSQNLSVRTVENQIYRAVLKLREKLVEESAVPCIY